MENSSQRMERRKPRRSIIRIRTNGSNRMVEIIMMEEGKTITKLTIRTDRQFKRMVLTDNGTIEEK
jgi:hypothetical protein